MSELGRVRPVARGCYLAAQLERLVRGGQPGRRSGMSRPIAVTDRIVLDDSKVPKAEVRRATATGWLLPFASGLAADSFD
jgi:hypothetical protein